MKVPPVTVLGEPLVFDGAPITRCRPRAFWGEWIRRTFVLHAWLGQIIAKHEPGDSDLRVFPAPLYEIAFAKASELIEETCRSDEHKTRSQTLAQNLSAEIWNFLDPHRRPREQTRKIVSRETNADPPEKVA